MFSRQVRFEQELKLARVPAGCFDLSVRVTAGVFVVHVDGVPDDGEDTIALSLSGVEVRERISESFRAWLEVELSWTMVAVMDTLAPRILDAALEYTGKEDLDPAWDKIRLLVYSAVAEKMSVVVGAGSSAELRLGRSPGVFFPAARGQFRATVDGEEWSTAYDIELGCTIDVNEIKLLWILATRTSLQRLPILQEIAGALSLSVEEVLRLAPRTLLRSIADPAKIAALERLLLERFGPLATRMSGLRMFDILAYPDRAILQALLGPRSATTVSMIKWARVGLLSTVLAALYTKEFFAYIEKMHEEGRDAAMLSWTIEGYMLLLNNSTNESELVRQILKHRGARGLLLANYGTSERDRFDAALLLGMQCAMVDINRYGTPAALRLVNSLSPKSKSNNWSVSRGARQEFSRLVGVRSAGDLVTVAGWRDLGMLGPALAAKASDLEKSR